VSNSGPGFVLKRIANDPNFHERFSINRPIGLAITPLLFDDQRFGVLGRSPFSLTFRRDAFLDVAVFSALSVSLVVAFSFGTASKKKGPTAAASWEE
jgi:hypothetical protein